MKKISWSKKIPFFQNTYVLRSLLLAYFAAIILMTIIIVGVFLVSGDGIGLKALIWPMLGVYLFFFLLMFLSSWIVMGNKYAIHYTIDEKGVEIAAANDKGKDIQKLAVAAGILMGNPGVAGAGLMIRENIITIEWKDIQEVDWDSQMDKVIIKCSFWKQVALSYHSEDKGKLKNTIDNHLAQHSTGI